MTSQHNDIPVDEPLDPQVMQWLESLRPTPARDPQAVRKGRERFLLQLETSYAPPVVLSLTGRSALSGRLAGRNHQNSNRARPVPRSRPRRLAFTGLALVLVATLLFLGGATVSAAKEALPGDALYSVKTQLEQTRLNLAQDAGNRAQIMMDYAERRLNEIDRLVQQGRFEDIETAVQQFEAAIHGAVAELNTVANGDPARAAALAAQISEALARYADTLSAIAAGAPDSVREDLDQAIQTAREAGNQSPGGVQLESLPLQATEQPGQNAGPGDDQDDQGALPTEESGAVVDDDETETGDGDGGEAGSGDDENEDGGSRENGDEAGSGEGENGEAGGEEGGGEGGDSGGEEESP